MVEDRFHSVHKGEGRLKTVITTPAVPQSMFGITGSTEKGKKKMAISASSAGSKAPKKRSLISIGRSQGLLLYAGYSGYFKDKDRRGMFAYPVDDSNYQKRWLYDQGYGLIAKLYNDSSAKELKDQIKALGDKGLKGKYGFAGLQSKTKNIFPQLLHIDDVTHINDFLEWAGQKETIVIFDEHCVIDFEDLPLPVQVVENQWRDRYENATIRKTEKAKKTTKGKKGSKMADDKGQEEADIEAEEDVGYTCGACGRKVDQELVKLHRKKCKAVKAKGLDGFDVSSDEDSNVRNGIHPELARILKGKAPEVHEVVDDDDDESDDDDDEEESSNANAGDSEGSINALPAVKDVKYDSAFGWVGPAKNKKRPAIDDDSYVEAQAKREVKRPRPVPVFAPRDPSAEPEVSFIEPTKEEKRISKFLQNVRSKLLDRPHMLHEFAEVAKAYFAGNLTIKRPQNRPRPASPRGPLQVHAPGPSAAVINDFDNSSLFGDAQGFEPDFGAPPILTAEEIQLIQQADDEELREAMQENLRINGGAEAKVGDAQDKEDQQAEDEAGEQAEEAGDEGESRRSADSEQGRSVERVPVNGSDAPSKGRITGGEKAFVGGIADRVKRREKNEGPKSATQDGATQGEGWKL